MSIDYHSDKNSEYSHPARINCSRAPISQTPQPNPSPHSFILFSHQGEFATRRQSAKNALLLEASAENVYKTNHPRRRGRRSTADDETGRHGPRHGEGHALHAPAHPADRPGTVPPSRRLGSIPPPADRRQAVPTANRQCRPPAGSIRDRPIWRPSAERRRRHRNISVSSCRVRRPVDSDSPDGIRLSPRRSGMSGRHGWKKNQ